MSIVHYTVRSIRDLLTVLPRVYGRPRRTVWFAEVDIEKADYDLIRFEELANSLNDKFAIKFRYDTVCKYVLPQLAVKD